MESQFHHGRAWSHGKPRPFHMPQVSCAARESSFTSPDSPWEQRPARPARWQGSRNRRNGAGWSDGMVAAGGSPGAVIFKTGGRTGRQYRREVYPLNTYPLSLWSAQGPVLVLGYRDK